MSKYGYIGKDGPTQAVKSNAGVLTPKEHKDLVIEEKIFPIALGGFIRLLSLNFFSLFSIFLSLASILSFCFSLLFIVKEETPLLNFAVIKSFIPKSISLVEELSEASGGFSSFLK